ncbi:MAG: patatin-like phospholipase family protein [Solirubrobacteraceae bacterium]
MIAFVMAGGASLGAVQVGMLRALYERQIAPELIIGSSVGAINGAYIASRPPTVQTAESLAERWRALHTFEVFPPHPITGLLGLLGRRDYFVPNTGVKALLAAHLQFERLEDSPIPLHVIATEVRTGTERRLSRGDAVAALLASTAIPGVFPPIWFQGEELMDGGISNNAAISDAAELGANRIYVLPTGISCELSTGPRGAIPMLVHALLLLIGRRLARDVEQFSHDVELIVLVPPCPLEVSPMDFSHASELIDSSYELACQTLDHPDPGAHGIPRALERLKPHDHD